MTQGRLNSRCAQRLALRLGMAALAAAFAAAASAQLSDFRQRPPEDEIIYFLLPDRFENGDPSNDRGGLRGGRLQTGFDPTHKGFFLSLIHI